MVESVLLIEGKNVPQERLASVSLMNAKQLVFGRFSAHGTIVHVAATTQSDLQQAVLKFSGVPGVSGVLTLAVRSGS